MQFITAHWSYHHHCSSSLGPTKQYKTKWPLFWQIHLLWEVLPRNPGRWGGIVRWSHSTCHVSLHTISLSLSSSLMKIKPVVFCNMLLLKFFGNLKYCWTFIVFHLEKFQKVSFLNWKMISWIMNLLWNVMNVDEKCIKFASFTLSLFGLMGKLLLIMYLS